MKIKSGLKRIKYGGKEDPAEAKQGSAK